MLDRSTIGAIAIATVLAMTSGAASAFDDAKYPNLKGQWTRARIPGVVGQPTFDPTKRWGTTQDAPLTAEYKAIFEANLADQANGGQGTVASSSCLPPGMPMLMQAYSPMEFIVFPDITYIRVDHVRDTRRRIYTDGRDWPKQVEPAFDGYSIGRWIDEDGDGRYDLLEVETRNLSGPRAYDASGLPLHEDNETIVKERIFLDKDNQNLLHDEITVFDHALTRPWTVMKSYRRSANPHPDWLEYICGEGNQLVRLGNENYMLSGEGYLMPTRKGQKPPDLKYFGRPQN